MQTIRSDFYASLSDGKKKPSVNMQAESNQKLLCTQGFEFRNTEQ